MRPNASPVCLCRGQGTRHASFHLQRDSLQRYKSLDRKSLSFRHPSFRMPSGHRPSLDSIPAGLFNSDVALLHPLHLAQGVMYQHGRCSLKSAIHLQCCGADTQGGSPDHRDTAAQMEAAAAQLDAARRAREAERREGAIQEVEMVLQTYFHNLDNTYNKLATINENMDDVEVTCQHELCIPWKEVPLTRCTGQVLSSADLNKCGVAQQCINACHLSLLSCCCVSSGVHRSGDGCLQK